MAPIEPWSVRRLSTQISLDSGVRRLDAFDVDVNVGGSILNDLLGLARFDLFLQGRNLRPVAWRILLLPQLPHGDLGGDALMKDARVSLNASPVSGVAWPAPVTCARCACNLAARASQTASKAGLWLPEITSLGKPALAS